MIIKRNLLLLTDWNYGFASKFVGDSNYHEVVNMDIDRMSGLLSEDFEVTVKRYQELDLSKCYRGWYVVYASSEERGMFYKDYIEDVLLKLLYDGAVLVPDFRCFRAHGNKAFQEMMRKQFKNASLRTLDSDIVGRLEELNSDKYDYPVVVKTASGSGSIGVRLAHSKGELRRIVKQLSFVRYHDQHYKAYQDVAYSKIGWMIKTAVYRAKKKSQTTENPSGFFHANKIVIQTYADGLDSDYKILYYYGKYYVLHRMNRVRDFRASGSGLFTYPENVEEIKSVLSYARTAAEEIDAPMISLDIARGKDRLYLIEFQCLNFGPYTIQYAQWHFECDETGEWRRVEGQDDIEAETVRSIKEYIMGKEKSNETSKNPDCS
ncbi:MAG: hypothetical protein E7211_20890 [Clostridium lundense]|nr:hypothetical protein [Clostridium lundense]